MSYQMFFPLNNTVPVFILVMFLSGQLLVLKGEKLFWDTWNFLKKMQKFLQSERELWDRVWGIVLTFWRPGFINLSMTVVYDPVQLSKTQILNMFE